MRARVHEEGADPVLFVQDHCVAVGFEAMAADEWATLRPIWAATFLAQALESA
jgi:hypothetical protein